MLSVTQEVVPENPTIPRYRQILKQHLPEKYLRPDNLNLLWFIPHMGVIGTGLWLLSAHFSWWFAPLIALVIGHSVGCLGFIAHEICHGGPIKNRKLRHFLAGVGFSPFGIGPYVWSRWHNSTHHSHTQSIEFDPDRLFTMEEYKNNKILKALYKLNPVLRNLVVFAFFSLMMSQHNIVMVWTYLRSSESTNRDRAAIIFQFLLPKILWIGITAFMGWKVLLMGYVIPLLAANVLVISYISTNHFLNPLADHDDVLASSLSVTLPKWLGWLDVLHSRFGAHVSHHLFPQAPSRYTRKIEEHIQQLWPDRFHVMPLSKALKLLWQTNWVYDEAGTALVDPQRNVALPTLGNGL